MSSPEYLRLPKGFFDRESEWIQLKRSLLESHFNAGNKIGAELIETAPLGFAETFKRGSNTAGEKIYNFLDRADRHIYLACDSTPGVLRHYVANHNNSVKRFTFASPLFRYRDGPTRHFTQIGYASINEPYSENETDFILIDLVEAIVQLARSVGLDIYVHVSDFKLVRNLCLKGGVNVNDIPEFLRVLQFSEIEKRAELLQSRIADPDILQILLSILVEGKFPDVYNEYVHKFSNALALRAGIKVLFDGKNMHSIETISGLALKFYTLEGVYIGDGGHYHDYGMSFSPSVKTLRSVATGVEVLSRNAKIKNPVKSDIMTIIGLRGVSDAYLNRVVETMRNDGISTRCYSMESLPSKFVPNLIKQKVSMMTIVEPHHEERGEVEVRYLQFTKPSLTKRID